MAVAAAAAAASAAAGGGGGDAPMGDAPEAVADALDAAAAAATVPLSLPLGAHLSLSHCPTAALVEHPVPILSASRQAELTAPAAQVVVLILS